MKVKSKNCCGSFVRGILLLLLAGVFSAAGLFAAAAGEQAGEQEVYTIRLHHGTPESDPTHMTALKFKELAEKYSDGRFEVTIFPNLQVEEGEAIQMMRLGSVEMSIPYIGSLQPLSPSVGVLMLPYMWKNRQEIANTMEVAYDELNKRVINETGVRMLALCDYAYRVLSTVRPVRNINDIRGQKIRVTPNNMALETFKSWGVNATPLAWGEVFTGLQQGVIEGVENPHTVVISQKFYEVLKYTTDIHYLLETKPIMVSETFYSKLPDDLKGILKEAADDTRTYISGQFETWVEEAREELTFLGVEQLGPPTDEDVWERLAREAWPKFYDSVGGADWATTFIQMKDSAN
jgi:TRAP-type transport system periplasmic protein